MLSSLSISGLEGSGPLRPSYFFRQDNLANVQLASYLTKYTSSDTTLAVHSAGMAPYFLDRYTIDVLGKADLHIAHLVVSDFSPGHSKWDWDYIIRERQPDLIDFETRDLISNPEFTARYVYVEGTGDVRFFVRKDALAKLSDPGLRTRAYVPE